ncbi:MAG: hypothetical protein Q7J31_04450 [Syntrophales bacterium]|nr:hypothetical protein [Syntrophales bacterium]
MKKTIMVCIMALTLCQGVSRADEVFSLQIDRAADQLVTAWKANNPRGMSEAVTRLLRYELYNAAIDECRGSYLCQIPPDIINQGEAALAAYIFLIRKEREGVSLWPKAILEPQEPKRTGRNNVSLFEPPQDFQLKRSNR